MFIINCLFIDGSGFVNVHVFECNEQTFRQSRLPHNCQIKH